MTASLQDNLQRIKELTKTVSPFKDTVRGVEIINPLNDKKAVMFPLHKEPAFAIAIVEVEEGFVHQNHFHEEYELICLLSGEAVSYFDDKKVELEVQKPILFDKLVQHENHFTKKSKVLVITIPASKDFPEGRKHE